MSLRFERSISRGTTRLFVAFDSWPINRPHLRSEWYTNDELGLSLSWGNGNSDPVWMLDLTFQVPEWLNSHLSGYEQPPAPLDAATAPPPRISTPRRSQTIGCKCGCRGCSEGYEHCLEPNQGCERKSK